MVRESRYAWSFAGSITARSAFGIRNRQSPLLNLPRSSAFLVRITTIIQTRVAPRGTLSTQRIQYPRFGLGGPIESTRHEFGGHSLAEQNLDILRAGARVSSIRAHASNSRSAGLRTADGPRFRTWV